MTEDDRVIVDNGLSRFVLGKGSSPILEIQQKDKRIAWADREDVRGLYVIDQKGRTAVASAKDATMQIETRGPTSACVRIEGFYRTEDGEELARHITRVEVAAGQPFAKVTHTLILIHDTNQLWFKDIGWELGVAHGANPKAIFGSSLRDPLQTVTVPITKGSSAWMMQDSHRRFGKGKNHFYVGRIANPTKRTSTWAHTREWTSPKPFAKANSARTGRWCPAWKADSLSRAKQWPGNIRRRLNSHPAKWCCDCSVTGDAYECVPSEPPSSF